MIGLCNLLFSQDYSNFYKYWPELKRVTIRKDIEIMYNPSICTYEKIDYKVSYPKDKENLITFKYQNAIYNVKYYSSSANPWMDYIFIENTPETIRDKGYYGCKVLCIPGNGSVYALTPLERNGFRKINFTEKYVLDNGTIDKIEQPIYSIEKESTAGIDLKLYQEKNSSSAVIANIVKDSKIRVIGFSEVVMKNGEIEYWYLLESPIGLIGWSKSEFIGNKVTYASFSISILNGDMP